MKAAIYARYSSDAQRASSIEDQSRNCRKRAEAEGWQVVAQFADAAMSGTDAARPQYLAMIAAAGRGEFEILLLDDLSRLTRDSVEQERTIRRLEFQGIRIVSTSDGYDSESKARKMHRGMKGLMNEMFLDDLRDKVHRGLSGQAMKRFWCGGKPYGFKLKPIVDESRLDPYGQPARIGTVLEIDPEQSPTVHAMFEAYASGASCQSIARDLNARGVPSPGATWKRKTRRCSGWMGSAVRVVIKNPLYTGRVRWNTSQFLRDPDTGKDRRRARPESEWLQFQDETLRIVSDDLWQKAQRRTRGSDGERLRSGGVNSPFARRVYLLSGLLRCDMCGAHYVMADKRAYICASRRDGACSNSERIDRTVIEAAILNPLRDGLLDPVRVKDMAIEMQRYLSEQLAKRAGRAETMPQEIQDIGARIDRLRLRLKAGDPDMPADEIQAAIDKAEAKRRDLEANLPEAKRSAKVLSILPKAAQMYRAQLEKGLGDDPRATLKARVILRDLVGGQIRLAPDETGGLWAAYSLQPGVLLRSAVAGQTGSPRPR